MTDVPDRFAGFPDQPDGIDEDSNDLPELAAAADRVGAYIAAWGDGLYDVEAGCPLYARDLEALRQHAAREQTR
jgi:hypothetical protein